ncbi:ectoine/hydroxyectoine ABC transporter permease subunit EhuD [Blastopirellula marina]|uniref:Ectoine/hydroxyectoine ABC transporter permease subunit EhuD n=1 Tax=Blastopirellula marina TaxID=124 RepID=A0A2S8GB90_9BACT|nr:ectoine/hydroxyectoine ABC transporter permease subunit EhuD [Blastopirellula marina]PQO41728.1 ectoine/hydroxyectoine ABC transporter permease subunit EhuD [Blastopirellula marina]PTL46171.1 ectoine/hydroxyectoine ABC transporter permease subunit EhuD [Blastopirellula marina]
MWNWDIVWEVMPDILQGLVVTLEAVAGGMSLALVLGLLWAVLRRTRIEFVSWPTWAFVEFIRSTPLLVQLFFVYYVMTDVVGRSLSPLLTGILVLGVHYSCYTAEVYRAGLDVVAKGQWNAAKALNLNAYQTYRYVILPQAIPPILPNLGNYLIAMLKEAPLLSVITVMEVLRQAQVFGNAHYRYLEPLTIVGVLFILLSLLAGLSVEWLRKRTAAMTS